MNGEFQREHSKYEAALSCLFHNQPAKFPLSVSDRDVCKKSFVGADLHDIQVPVDFPVDSGTPGAVERKVVPYGDFLSLVLVEKKERLYVKDWHIDQSDVIQVQVPVQFEDDWLNWYWQHIRRDLDSSESKCIDDYSFAYIGAKHSFTGVHHDVCYSYSWSMNVAGTKRWTLWPPEDNKMLFSCKSGELVKDARRNKYESSAYPDLDVTDSRVTIVQRAQEVVFVPSGWYHMVENITATQEDADVEGVGDTEGVEEDGLTISLNRNWFNAINLQEVVRFVLREWRQVRICVIFEELCL